MWAPSQTLQLARLLQKEPNDKKPLQYPRSNHEIAGKVFVQLAFGSILLCHGPGGKNSKKDLTTGVGAYSEERFGRLYRRSVIRTYAFSLAQSSTATIYLHLLDA